MPKPQKAQIQDRRLIESRMVPDPSMSDAEYFNQRRVRPGPNVGRVAVQHNMVELIGGFARVQDRTEVQTMAAARYRNLFEAAQLGGARAVDLTAVRVDTSGPSPELTIEKGAWARQKYSEAVQLLGMQRSSLVERGKPPVRTAGSIARRQG